MLESDAARSMCGEASVSSPQMADRRDAATPDAASQGTRAETSELSFETALSRLEDLVARLEGGDLELEAALAVFEEGVALSRRCAEQLDQTERRIDALVREGAELVERPFEDESDEPVEGR
jgi:exodeoxyribonuclease VII small subunit